MKRASWLVALIFTVILNVFGQLIQPLQPRTPTSRCSIV